MNDPLISVLIINCNDAPNLADAIESALDQTGVRSEVIVVDDGSTDGSRAVIERFGDRIVPVFLKNGGQAAALNAGVALSRGAILCFLDADDWWRADKLSAIAAAFAANPEAGLVYHRLQPKLPDGSDAFRSIPASLCSGDLAPRMASSGGRWPYPMMSAVSVRRSLWIRAGDIPDAFRISADAWLVGVYPFLAPVIALPKAFGFYRIQQDAWYRNPDDATILRKRIGHWETLIRLSNAFLRKQGLPWCLDPNDHHPLQLARARLEGAPLGLRARLLLHGLRDVGEPNPLRRTRDALRAVRCMTTLGLARSPVQSAG